MVWALLFLGAFFLRIHRLDAVNLRGDEAYSVVHWTATPFSEKWFQLARSEPAPVGAFILYWAWEGVVGPSEFAIRMLSVWGNLLGLAVVVPLARHFLTDRRAGWLIALLWFTNPYLIWHAQDARVYGVLSALTPLSFYLFLRATAAKNGQDSSSSFSRVWLPYIAVQTVTIYLYYFEIFWLAAQGVYVLALIIAGRRDLIRPLFRAWVAVGVLVLPVVLQAYYLLFINRYEGNATGADFPALFSEFIPTLLFGDNTVPFIWGLVFVALLFAGLLWMLRDGKAAAGILMAWIAVPPLLLYLVSFQSEFFRPRYVTTIIPGLLIALLAVMFFALTKFGGKSRAFAAVGVFTLALTAVSAAETNDYFYHDTPKAPAWRELTSQLDRYLTADDILITGDLDPALEYYYPDGNIYFLPLNLSNLENEYRRLMDKYIGIYILSGQRSGDTLRFFQQEGQSIPGTLYPGVIQFRGWEVHPREIQNPLAVQFGDVAILRGYTVLQEHTATPVLLLYWEALRQTNAEHSILVHLEVSPDTPPVATLDHGLANSIISLTQWKAGVLYRDPIVLPTDLAEGTYTIRVGIYDTATVEKLPLYDLALESQHAGRYPITALPLP